MEARDWKRKNVPETEYVFLAERAGFENLLLNGGAATGKQKHTLADVFLSAERAGFEPATGFKPGTHLAGEPIQPLWHLPRCVLRLIL
jgi:hypothetical protein